MFFAYVFCIFVTVSVSVQCDGGHHISKRHNDFTVSKEVDCMVHRKGITSSMINSTCRPHYRHVSLKSMPLQEFRPAVVLVKRCHGHCPGNACMPTERQMIKVPVKLAHHDPTGQIDDMCAMVEVEEHTRCKCMCIEVESDCNVRQYYEKSRCACICMDREMKKHMCELKMGMVWDDDDCSCNCTEMNIECTSGLKWNKEKCACM